MKRAALLILLLLVLTNPVTAQERRDLIRGFFQGIVTVDPDFKKCSKDYNNGNCAAIAVIKASLAEFDNIGGIFTAYRVDGDSIRCTFRDGTVIAIGPQERAIVDQLAGIRPDSATAIREDAITLYALICKRMWVRRSAFTPSKKFTKCVKSFRDAVQFLNSGYPTVHANRLLALDTVNITDYSTIANLNSVIVYSSPHAAFSTMGTQDQFGRSYTIVQVMRNSKPTGKWLMGTANSHTSRIIGAYRLALPQ